MRFLLLLGIFYYFHLKYMSEVKYYHHHHQMFKHRTKSSPGNGTKICLYYNLHIGVVEKRKGPKPEPCWTPVERQEERSPKVMLCFRRLGFQCHVKETKEILDILRWIFSKNVKTEKHRNVAKPIIKLAEKYPHSFIKNGRFPHQHFRFFLGTKTWTYIGI